MDMEEAVAGVEQEIKNILNAPQPPRPVIALVTQPVREEPEFEEQKEPEPAPTPKPEQQEPHNNDELVHLECVALIDHAYSKWLHHVRPEFHIGSRDVRVRRMIATLLFSIQADNANINGQALLNSDSAR